MGYDSPRPALIDAVSDQIIDIMCDLDTSDLTKLYQHFVTHDADDMEVIFKRNSVAFKLKKLKL